MVGWVVGACTARDRLQPPGAGLLPAAVGARKPSPSVRPRRKRAIRPPLGYVARAALVAVRAGPRPVAPYGSRGFFAQCRVAAR